MYSEKKATFAKKTFYLLMPSQTKDQEAVFIAHLKDGEETAWRKLFDMHYVVMCRYAEHFLHDDFQAEMVVGDVYFNLWKVRKSLDVNINLRAYMLKAIHNTCLNILSSQYHRMETTFSELQDDDGQDAVLNLANLSDDNHPLGILLEKELEEEILVAISHIPEESKEVFLLSRREGKSYEEISNELNISVNTVKYHIKQALSLLRKELSPYLVMCKK